MQDMQLLQHIGRQDGVYFGDDPTIKRGQSIAHPLGDPVCALIDVHCVRGLGTARHTMCHDSATMVVCQEAQHVVEGGHATVQICLRKCGRYGWVWWMPGREFLTCRWAHASSAGWSAKHRPRSGIRSLCSSSSRGSSGSPCRQTEGHRQCQQVSETLTYALTLCYLKGICVQVYRRAT
jgi:hypothetical protein